MKNFGKMTFSPEIVEQHGQDYKVLFLCDQNGVDWFDLVEDHPHPFYIAVNADGLIFSMEQDYQAIQTEGVLIGIDSDFGFTRGPGGSVYGKLWNGTAIVEPAPEPEPTIVIPAVTFWERTTEAEGFAIEAMLNQQPFRIRQIFMTAQSYRSDHDLWPLLQNAAVQLFGENRAAELLAQP